jgi:hypothetical protein
MKIANAQVLHTEATVRPQHSVRVLRLGLEIGLAFGVWWLAFFTQRI